MSDAQAIRRAAAVMVVLVLVWGYAWIVAKMALAYCGPLDLATLRTAVGAATLFPALVWMRGPVWPEHPWEALAVGTVQTALFLLLNNWALAQGGAGKTSVLVFTMPFWVLLFAWPMLHREGREGTQRDAKECQLMRHSPQLDAIASSNRPMYSVAVPSRTFASFAVRQYGSV